MLKVDFLYERHPSMEGYQCYYCGDTANTKDHIPPKSAVEALGSKEYRRFTLVRACLWCNSKLGAKQLLTLKERKAYIKDALHKELDRMSSPWTEEELESLGFVLRQLVEERQLKRDSLSRRANWVYEAS
jgi:ethanolamine ammonia-lyase small subunit